MCGKKIFSIVVNGDSRAKKVGLGIPEQSAETFLLKMLVVGENIGQPFAAHGLYRTVGAAVVNSSVVVTRPPERRSSKLMATWECRSAGFVNAIQ
jgi:hypothetical protein